MVKVQLRYIRRIMESDSQALTLFATFLRSMKGWDGYVVDPWEANDTLQRQKGKHTKEFVCSTDAVVTLLNCLLSGNRVLYFCKFLVEFRIMYIIIGLILIDEYDKVIEILRTCSPSTQQLALTITTDSNPDEISDAVILKYKEEAKIMYEFGHKTCITRLQPGDAETFYLHILRHYVPWLLEDTYRNHRLGAGIFSMEAFEYKNYT